MREALAAAADVRRRHGRAALDTVIVSGTTSAADVLSVFDLSDEPLSVVPLFETISDLGRRAGVLRELLADPRFARRAGGSRVAASR